MNLLQIGGNSGTYVLYDTFSFKLTLPPLSNKLEFCVCFRSDTQEYWDSNDVSIPIIPFNIYLLPKTDLSLLLISFPFQTNDKQGKNYTILKRTSNTSRQNSSFLLKTKGQATTPISIPQKYTDLSQAKMAAWSEFASWNHLENTSPYWWYSDAQQSYIK